MRSKKETSQLASQLKNRIRTNNEFGNVDLSEWLIEKLEVKNGQTILDVGCGTGDQLIKLASLFPRGKYYGVDLSKESITEARTQAEHEGLTVTFIHGDASDIAALPDRCFDIVMSIYALYYVTDVQNILSCLLGKLAPSGSLVVMSPYKGNNDSWYAFLSSFMNMPREIESIANDFMDTEVLPFARAHFSNVRTCEFQNNIRIPTYEDLKKYWLSNVYHREEVDRDFEVAAREVFMMTEQFVITKRALLAVMS
jgi:ubiquinone/menaquinone biosynthesis C-methylase UbiE